MTTVERDRFERSQLNLWRGATGCMFAGLFFLGVMAGGQLGSQIPLALSGVGMIVCGSIFGFRESYKLVKSHATRI